MIKWLKRLFKKTDNNYICIPEINVMFDKRYLISVQIIMQNNSTKKHKLIIQLKNTQYAIIVSFYNKDEAIKYYNFISKVMENIDD